MKLFASFSEAIREGAKLRPRGAWKPFDGYGTAFIVSCAIGAGYEAISGNTMGPEQVIYDIIETAYPYLRNPAPACPISDCADNEADGDLSDLIIHLNDDHEWSRERIADWLETEEEKLGFITLTESEEVITSLLTVAALSKG